MVTPELAGQRLDVFLASVVRDVSRSQLARHIAEGAVTVSGARTVPSHKVKSGDVVVWTPPPVAPVALVAEEIPFTVVYDDRHLLVLDKPAGLVVHPAPGHESGTLVNALLQRITDLRGIGGELRPGIVHRLDKGTSGLMVVAKDDATLNALAIAFRAHDITRAYDAIGVGKPPAESGRIDTLHGRDPRDRKKFTIKVKTGRRAMTRWGIAERLGGGAVRLRVELETGRTHQVRVHMSALGLPLLGDLTYGKPPRHATVREIARRLGRQALHARKLGFRHPVTGEALEFESEPPEDFQVALGALRALVGEETTERGETMPRPRARLGGAQVSGPVESKNPRRA